MSSSLEWLRKWYLKQCNGEWELDHHMKIASTDHPGWQLEVDLGDTPYDNIVVFRELIENGESDWYTYSVQDSIFAAAGDSEKLEFLLELFRKVIEKGS